MSADRYRGIRLFRRVDQFKPRPKNPPGLSKFAFKRTWMSVKNAGRGKLFGMLYRGERPPFRHRRAGPWENPFQRF